MSAPTVAEFPVDETTLDLLHTALHPGTEAERSSLYDLLELMSDMHYGVPTGVDEDDVTVLDRPRWSVHDVIEALIGEVRRLRQEV